MAVEPFVEQFDHFVMPVDDLVAAEDFYTTVLGAPIARNRFGPMRLGLNVAQRKISLRPITFIKIGGKRIGLSLQDEMRPQSDDVRGAPTFSFETTSVGLKAVAAALEERGDAYELGKHHHEAIPYESLFCKDPAGNFLHLFVPDVPRREPGVAADSIVGHATAVSHLQLEAPDLDSAVRFYVDTLGLPLRGNGVNSRLDVREATLALPSGQLLILTELPFSPKGMNLTRKVGGPHLGFYVPSERWDRLIGHLETQGVGHADRTHPFKGRQQSEQDTYLDEPSGYVIQLVGKPDA